MEAIRIGNRREMFWDNALTDSALTTAPLLLRPAEGEGREVFTFDMPWEQTCLGYMHLVKVEDTYRLYYKSHTLTAPSPGYMGKLFVSVIESEDGIHWRRPLLDIVPFPGYEKTNILFDDISDNFFVFYDPNPACPKEEKFKGIARAPVVSGRKLELVCYPSADGYHFGEPFVMTTKGYFDTMNTATWADGRYTAYIRNFHYPKYPVEGVDYTQWNNLIRSITVMHSEDFRNWSDPVELEYEDELEYPLYTNNVERYYRAPHMLIGFPVRYKERPEWTENFAGMPAPEERLALMERTEKRSGLAITDAIFMCSRDSEHWHRYNEAFFSLGYENAHNWYYGNGYPCYGRVVTEGAFDYMYVTDKYRTVGLHQPLLLHKVRKDGFACRCARDREEIIVTKPIVYEGEALHLNFETSVCGYIYVSLLDEDGNAISDESFEVFGNTIDRTVTLPDNAIANNAGKPLRLRFRMKEAKLYSMKFE